MPVIETKKQLGQFFTTNSHYILQNLVKYVKDKRVTDPFAGSGDLLRWASENGAQNVSGYDVDKRYVDDDKILLGDSILYPRQYDFVITNPPYLNVNKAGKPIKEIYFQNSKFEDLYQLSLNTLLNSNEGIVIVPINFLSAENSSKIRNIFFEHFKILEMNYFKQQVFPDTTYNVIAFYYQKKSTDQRRIIINTHVYPGNQTVSIVLQQKYDWLIGGDLVSTINAQANILGIRRLTEADMAEQRGEMRIKCAYNHVSERRSWRVSAEFLQVLNSNIILLKAIDSGSQQGKIALEDIRNYGVSCLVSKPTSRHMIYLIFEQKISIERQKKLIDLFNVEIERLRDKYMSLFLTNYRDKDRKRIGFDFCYKFLSYLYVKHIASGRLL